MFSSFFFKCGMNIEMVLYITNIENIDGANKYGTNKKRTLKIMSIVWIVFRIDLPRYTIICGVNKRLHGRKNKIYMSFAYKICVNYGIYDIEYIV